MQELNWGLLHCRWILYQLSYQGSWDNIKCTKIFITRVPEGEEKEKGTEKIFEELIAKNIPKMGKEIVNQVQEAQRLPGRINSRRNTPRHIIIKLPKTKDNDKILKATRDKQQITHKGTLIRLSADFSIGALQAKKEWHDIFKVIKENNVQPRTFYLAKLSLRFDGEIKSFPEKKKLIEFSTTKPTLQQILKEFLKAVNTRKRPTENKPNQ